MNPITTRRARRLTAMIAGLAAASVVLSGCLYQLIPEAPDSTASPAPDTEGVSSELLPYYGQTLEWESCSDGQFQCTMVTAPLDWANPDAGDIELSLIRQRATAGEAVGSLLVNPGGPGQSGVNLIRDSVDFAVGEPLQEDYDVVGFDPRGVGESTAVRCFDAEEMDSFLFDIPQNPRGSDAWEQEVVDSQRAFAEACDANSDGILPFITTQNAARDLDLMRAVLGDTSLNYLGYSYGTFLGATYAELFPEKVGRLVLDGATDPSIPGLEQGVVQAIGFENALRAYMADCLDSGDECPFRGTVDDALADLATLLASVDRSPIPAADGRELGADALMTAISTALYSQASWEYLTVALSDVLQGNAEVAFQLVDFYFDRDPSGVYTLNGYEGFLAYNCMDFPLDPPEAEEQAKATLAAEAPTIAPYWWGPDPCEVWPYPPTGVREPIAAEGAAPIVVVGTTNDPATPYEWAVALADQLSSGVLVTRVGEGHTGYNKGNKCVDRAVEEYFRNGTVPDDGLRCE